MFEPAEMSPERPLPPVRWLFGPDLLASLRKIALYAFSFGKLDLRDWMAGSIHDELKDREGTIWFDYVADTGDGQVPMLSIARLCLSDVTVEEAAAGVLDDAPEVRLPLTLPRGEFLFVGGDTAYHIADKPTLDARFCAPFRLAAAQVGLDRDDRRPLFGIPGNHDYYDQLDGFNRQFRVPLQGHEGAAPADELPLDVPGFRRVQNASYMAIQLPHGFWLFGMDTEQDKLDARQSAFFRDILTRHGAAPLKVIVATPSPTIICGKSPRRSDAAVLPLLDIEELWPPFVRHGKDAAPAEAPRGDRHAPAKAEIERESQLLPQGECRLYLSGDLHHYERYFGARDDAGRPACCAAVVSGGGGSFLQPSHTDFGEVAMRRVYPSAPQSRRAMTALFRPWVVLSGGYIPIFGALVAVALYSAAAILRAPWAGLDALLRLLLGLTPPGRPQQDLSILRAAGEKVGCVLLITALLGAAALAFTGGASALERRGARRSSPAAAPPVPRKKAAFNGRIAVGWGLLGLSVAVVLAGAWGENALWVAFPALLVAVALTAAGVWQSNRLIRAGATRLQAAVVTLLCAGVGAAMTAASLSLARSELSQAQSMVFDFGIGLLLLVMLLVTAVGLPLLGAAVHRRLARKLLFIGFGLYNFALITAVPFVLTRTLAWGSTAVVSLAALGVVTALLSALGRAVFVSAAHRRWLGVLWLALGAIWLLAPVAASVHELATAPSPWAQAAFVALAAVLGAVITSMSFGWYFAVADTWGGHSNEVGGAALIEDYKQLIRFRLTPEGLTGFVIAIDRPALDPAREGRPRLVDVFELRPRA